MILAGDIGGTNARLAGFVEQSGQLEMIALKFYPSKDHSNLAGILRDFTNAHTNEIESVCLGIAGPVMGGIVRTPNLPWTIDSRKIAKQLGVDNVRLVNDLQANATGILALGEDDFEVINTGRETGAQNIGLIAAGTGLGEAGCIWDGERYFSIPSEGGHADFSPRNLLEIEMLSFAKRDAQHISQEYFLSGPGLVRIYDFLVASGREQEPDWLSDAMGGGNRAALISQHAADESVAVCVRAMEIFVSLYAAEAGNLALKLLATGGMYLGGGIAPKIVGHLKHPRFMEEFTAKGRMRSLLSAIPVKVIMNDQTALWGAARLGAEMIRHDRSRSFAS